MKAAQVGRWTVKLGLIAALAAQAGCQTWVAGMTLPSPHYLDHQPQYIPESPSYPLTRELATMQEQQNAAQPQGGQAGPAAPLAPIVPNQ